ncbi:hypothetical protein [Mycolicibacterium lutetiense]|uniref:Uncharacterized protein n=1 Tax=Mycolicibacterium lutetiense TaxID=1641992 RepID=A0ABS5A3K4_9MYCO|nr:hypothetical protein [Mycolicibacterium lutetiense]MBP2455963.1 hypothetical protein [Mycolicibacterium lutetiense]
MLEFMVRSVIANQSLYRNHTPEVFDGDMALFSARQHVNGRLGDSAPESRWRMFRNRMNPQLLLRSWRPYVSGRVSAFSVDCTHYEMLAADSLTQYGDQLRVYR